MKERTKVKRSIGRPRLGMLDELVWFHMAILKGVWIIEVNGGVGYRGPAERQDTKRNII